MLNKTFDTYDMYYINKRKKCIDFINELQSLFTRHSDLKSIEFSGHKFMNDGDEIYNDFVSRYPNFNRYKWEEVENRKSRKNLRFLGDKSLAKGKWCPEASFILENCKNLLRNSSCFWGLLFSDLLVNVGDGGEVKITKNKISFMNKCYTFKKLRKLFI